MGSAAALEVRLFATIPVTARQISRDDALQVMKNFTGGGKHDSKKPNSSTDLLSLAMAEASKLFDKSGGSSSGNKQDAVNSAGMTIMKMMLKSKFSGTTGGKDSGGLGSLMSMVSSSSLSIHSNVHILFRLVNSCSKGLRKEA